MTNSIADIDVARTIMVIGANTTSAHPVIGHRMRRAARNGATLIVINPKEIDLTHAASHFLQPRPGTDVALLMGMARYIIETGLADESFIAARTEGYAEFVASLQAYTPEFVVETTGLPWSRITEIARIYATNKPSSIFYAMGITQHSHGTDSVKAVANLALVTGSLGAPGTGVNPLRGQNNVQGACDMGCLPNVYPGSQRVDDSTIQKKFESAWNAQLPNQPGLTHTEIFDAICDGGIDTLYMVGENPLLTEANSGHVRAALERLDFFVVQDIFLSESATYADVVLPAASFAEKDGTFTNTERRVQRVRRAINPVGDSRPDWWIVSRIAERMDAPGFSYSSPEAIMREINQVTPSYGGITYERIENNGLQWPCPDTNHPGTPYLFPEKFSRPGGKACFSPLTYRPPAETADGQYPLILTTDRSLFHFHSSTMTRRVAGLSALDANEWLCLHPADAERYGIADGDWVEVSSRRGTVKVQARLTDVCQPGLCSMTFHFHESPTNLITNPALDPVAKIPETKVTAVSVRPLL
jgi:formate dehydrogenase alpha subunit